MTANSKSLVLLAVTLIVGFSLGLFADATLVRERGRRLEGLGRPLGFVDHIAAVIAPHGTAQNDSIRPVIEKTAKQNQEIMRDANVRLRAQLDSMRIALSPMLDASQRDRLAEEVTRMPGFGPGRGGRGRGGPPFGRRGGFPPGGRPPGDRGGPP